MRRVSVSLSLMLMSCACTAYRVPTKQLQFPAPMAARLKAQVSVATLPAFDSNRERITARDDIGAQRLAADLRETGLFVDVTVGDPPASPDTLKIKPEWSQRFCFSEPLLTALTLGFIPDISCYYLGHRFTIENVASPVEIDTRRRMPRVWGWPAAILFVFPGWDSHIPHSLEIVELRDALLEHNVLSQ